MSDTTDSKTELERLRRDVSELRGLALTTGVILTQLLQTTTLRELNPQAVATRIIGDARDAIEMFRNDHAGSEEPEIKARALQGLNHYERQLRSVLPV